MTIEFNWYLPTHGDGRHLANSGSGNNHSDSQSLPHANGGFRHATPDYLAQVAQAAEWAGFHAALIPTGAACHDAWLVAAGLARETSRLKFLVAFRPGMVLPAVAAQTVQTLDAFSGGRVLLNVVTGGSQAEQRGYGDFLDHDQRYARTDEFLEVVKRVWRGRGERGVDFTGEHYRLEGGGLLKPLTAPAIYFGGSSPAAERVAAKHADVYLQWGEPPEQFTANIARVRALAAAQGRRLRFGYRVHVIARDTEAEAWNEAERLLREVPHEVIEQAQRQLAASQSVAQARMRALHHGRAAVENVRDLEVSPNLWAGIGLVRGGAGTAFVGSHRQVAERFAEYHDLGIDSFILSAYPNLEEAVRVGEEVLPLVPLVLRQAQPVSARSNPVPAPVPVS